VAAHVAALPPPPPPPPAQAAPGAPIVVPPPPPPAPTEADLEAALRKAEGLQAYVDAAKAAAPGIDELVQARAALAGPVPMAVAALAAGDLAAAQAIRAQVPDAPPSIDLTVLDASLALAAGKPDAALLDRLAQQGAALAGPDQARAQAATALVAALGGPSDGQARAALAGFDLGPAQAPAARLLTLDLAADAALKGEAGLLALTAAEPGGADGPRPAARAAIVHALARAGLADDARAFAVEGLIALEPR